jgi:hypothetical protein
MSVTFMLLFSLFWACATSYIAKKNVRNTYLAFFLGFCFGVFAFIGYLIAGKTQDQKDKEYMRKDYMNK